jgi:hypothetical protein
VGIIDKCETKLTCAVCQKSEMLIAVEKGSPYGSSGWGPFCNSKYFDVETVGSDHLGFPTVKTAKCKKCNCNAEIEG